MDELEQARKLMVDTFTIFRLTDQFNAPKRNLCWDEYVMMRENFLRLDAIKNKTQYLPLHMTMIPTDPYRRGH